MAGRKAQVHVHIRVSEAEKRAWTKAADELGLPLTQWIRQTCRRASNMPSVLADPAKERDE